MRRFLDIFETQILWTRDISDSSSLVLTIPAAYCKARSQHHHSDEHFSGMDTVSSLLFFSPKPF